MISQSRRGLILGLAGLFAAPAIVRATSLMPISVAWPSPPTFLYKEEFEAAFNNRLSPLWRATKEIAVISGRDVYYYVER